jgi:hypothetical protein
MSSSLDRDLLAYLSKHRARGIMLDTNVMLLFLFAAFMPDKIEGTKRLGKYDREAGELLLNYVSQFDKIITTPHVMAETSNLARQNVHGKLWFDLSKIIYPIFCSTERRLEIRDVDLEQIKFPAFSSLGLTDSALASILGDSLLLTDDLDLYLTVTGRHDAIKFTHMRELAGNL